MQWNKSICIRDDSVLTLLGYSHIMSQVMKSKTFCTSETAARGLISLLSRQLSEKLVLSKELKVGGLYIEAKMLCTVTPLHCNRSCMQYSTMAKYYLSTSSCRDHCHSSQGQDSAILGSTETLATVLSVVFQTLCRHSLMFGTE